MESMTKNVFANPKINFLDEYHMLYMILSIYEHPIEKFKVIINIYSEIENMKQKFILNNCFKNMLKYAEKEGENIQNILEGQGILKPNLRAHQYGYHTINLERASKLFITKLSYDFLTNFLNSEEFSEVSPFIYENICLKFKQDPFKVLLQIDREIEKLTDSNIFRIYMDRLRIYLKINRINLGDYLRAKGINQSCFSVYVNQKQKRFLGIKKIYRLFEDLPESNIILSGFFSSL